jgi:hypothetical protein
MKNRAKAQGNAKSLKLRETVAGALRKASKNVKKQRFRSYGAPAFFCAYCEPLRATRASRPPCKPAPPTQTPPGRVVEFFNGGFQEIAGGL